MTKTPKKKPKGGGKPKRRSRVGCVFWGIVLLAGLGAALYFSFDYLKGLYLSHITSSVEEIVGTLDEDGVKMSVANEETAKKVISDLEGVELRSLGLFSVKVEKKRAQRITGSLRLDRDHYGFAIVFLKETAYTGPPKLAIIIDDMGQNAERDEKFLDLSIPVTPAILPYLGDSEKTAGLAERRGIKYLLHLPMEPKGDSANPGEGAILAGMGREKVRGLLKAALSSVGGASGVNNHMGSRATEDKRVMDAVMEELSVRGLFFVDSKTTAGTAGPGSAERYGVRAVSRDVFIDNEQDEEAIAEKLEEAVDIALKKGRAVAIGHSHEATLNALEDWQGKVKRTGVEVVPVASLVNRACP